MYLRNEWSNTLHAGQSFAADCLTLVLKKRGQKCKCRLLVPVAVNPANKHVLNVYTRFTIYRLEGGEEL